MNLIRRRMLLRGTKHCPTHRLKRICAASCLILSGALATSALTDWSIIAAASQSFQAQRDTREAKQNTRECLDVLSGNVRMLDPDNGEVAEVKWIKLKPM